MEMAAVALTRVAAVRVRTHVAKSLLRCGEWIEPSIAHGFKATFPQPPLRARIFDFWKIRGFLHECAHQFKTPYVIEYCHTKQSLPCKTKSIAAENSTCAEADQKRSQNANHQCVLQGDSCVA